MSNASGLRRLKPTGVLKSSLAGVEKTFKLYARTLGIDPDNVLWATPQAALYNLQKRNDAKVLPAFALSMASIARDNELNKYDTRYQGVEIGRSPDNTIIYVFYGYRVKVIINVSLLTDDYMQVIDFAEMVMNSEAETRFYVKDVSTEQLLKIKFKFENEQVDLPQPDTEKAAIDIPYSEFAVQITLTTYSGVIRKRAVVQSASINVAKATETGEEDYEVHIEPFFDEQLGEKK